MGKHIKVKHAIKTKLVKETLTKAIKVNGELVVKIVGYQKNATTYPIKCLAKMPDVRGITPRNPIRTWNKEIHLIQERLDKGVKGTIIMAFTKDGIEVRRERVDILKERIEYLEGKIQSLLKANPILKDRYNNGEFAYIPKLK